ncbi:hypothetical protein [Rhizobium sophoriradicis]|uniref:hypothetical protein n=1 Tax=Rhizobium sophoriradicis TaxID=1535245 RepID=UPI00148327F1|nr:hypothetical protein [Rhizobium sophoriradicis]
MKKETATTSATIFAWRPLVASCCFSLVSAVVIDLPMKIPDDAAETGRKIDRRSAARGHADIESRALAEYARCRWAERPNLALAGNIPAATALPLYVKKKPRRSEAKFEPFPGKQERRKVHSPPSFLQRGQIWPYRYARY